MKAKGFIGITELIIVLAIVSTLLGVGAGGFIFAKQRAKEARAIEEMGNILGPAMDQFKVDIGYYPTTATPFTSANGYGLISPPSASYDKWKGPYARFAPGTTWMNDPWKQPYQILGNGTTCVAIVSGGRNKAIDVSVTNTNPCTFSHAWSNISGRFQDVDDLGYVFTR